MRKNIENVPRYFEPHVNDCFSNAYATVLLHMGLNPNIILADYLSFMYDENSEMIGTNFLYYITTTVEFTEEQLNTSMEFAYLPSTTTYTPYRQSDKEKFKDKIQIQMLIHDDPEVAHSRLKQLIDANRPVIVFVDLHYMSYHRAYKVEHGLHSVVITGYDDDARMYDVFDIYKLSTSDFDGKLPYEEIQQGRSSLNPIINPLVGNQNRPIRNLWIEIEKGSQFNISHHQIWNIIEESCNRMLGQKRVLGQSCGLERLSAFKRDLLLKKEQELDEREVFLFKNYFMNFKSVGRNRARFKVFLEEVADILPRDLHKVTGDLAQTAKLWEVCASLALKLGITKRTSYLENLDKQLTTIIDIESRIVEHLAQWIHAENNGSQVAVSMEGGE